MKERRFHPVATLFPLMTGAEYAALKDDIARNGLREALWLHPDGSIVDGRNRYNACQEVGIEPEYRTWDGEGNLIAFVLSLNLHRRHLDTGQRAMIAARLAKMDVGRPDKTNGSIDLFVSQPEAAQLLNVSVPSVKRAKVIQEQGTPELVEAVEKGTVSLNAAVQSLDHRQRHQGFSPTLRLAAANHIISDDPEYDGDEWYTPAEFIEAARVLMGAIDLDPASCSEAQKTVKATRYFTKANNGLIQTWRGRVWMNPPYSTPLIGKFVQKAIAEAESEHIHQAVILVNNSTDTEWFQSLTCRFPVMFSRGRAKFWRANAGIFGARQGQALFYVGLQVQRFYECFEQIAYVPIGVAHDYS